MTLGGIGPKLALLNLPYIILALVVMQRDSEFLNLSFLDSTWIKIFGFTWLSVGLLFWIASALVFLRGFKTGQLITWGPYGWSRNPIYASMILFVIPALCLIFHSGLILSIALVLYIGFKISIHGETVLLRRTFGDKFNEYEQSVNELFPFPSGLLNKKYTNPL